MQALLLTRTHRNATDYGHNTMRGNKQQNGFAAFFPAARQKHVQTMASSADQPFGCFKRQLIRRATLFRNAPRS